MSSEHLTENEIFARNVGEATTEIVYQPADRTVGGIPLEEGGVPFVFERAGNGALSVRFMAGALPFAQGIQGSVAFHDPGSLIEYVERQQHGTQRAEAFIDLAAEPTPRVTVILDAYYRPGGASSAPLIPGCRKNLATYQAEVTREFVRWRKAAGKAMPQAEFARFLEDNQAYIAEPKAAQLIQVVRALKAKKAVDWEVATDDHTGDIVMSYAEKTTAKGGSDGSLVLPETIVVGLDLYQGVSDGPYRLDAKISFEFTTERKLFFSFRFPEIERVLDEAARELVNGLRDQLAEKCPVYIGTPAFE